MPDHISNRIGVVAAIKDSEIREKVAKQAIFESQPRTGDEAGGHSQRYDVVFADSFNNVSDLVKACEPNGLSPDLMLVDIDLPGEDVPLSVESILADCRATMRVLFISGGIIEKFDAVLGELLRNPKVLGIVLRDDRLPEHFSRALEFIMNERLDHGHLVALYRDFFFEQTNEILGNDSKRST